MIIAIAFFIGAIVFFALTIKPFLKYMMETDNGHTMENMIGEMCIMFLWIFTFSVLVGMGIVVSTGIVTL